jgi:hypothetical protein
MFGNIGRKVAGLPRSKPISPAIGSTTEASLHPLESEIEPDRYED